MEKGTKILKGADILIGFLERQDNFFKEEVVGNINSRNHIEVAVLTNCPWSARIIRILNAKGIEHKIMNIDNDEEFEQIQKRSNNSTFPQIFIDDKYIGGYDQFIELLSNGSSYKK